MTPHRLGPGAVAAALLAAWALGATVVVRAHPTPFSYVDVRLRNADVALTISAHAVDVAHELQLDPPERLFEDDLSRESLERAFPTLLDRLSPRIDGEPLTCRGGVTVETLAQMQAIRWSAACTAREGGGTLTVDDLLFPYDPEHLTFINLYVDDALVAQAVLDGGHRSASLATARPSGFERVLRLLRAGVTHILGGADHLLFLGALLLAGGTLRRLALIVTAFTIAHSITLALAVLGVVAPPPTLIEPLIALSIVVVGAGNFRRRAAGEHRALVAGAFGLIHGFGFASALREMSIARGELGWSLFSFNLGVELGQLAVVLVAATIFGVIRRIGTRAERRLVIGGSVIVVSAGTFWFVERVLSLW